MNSVLKWGLILGVALAVIQWVSYFSGITFESYNWVLYPVQIGVSVFAIWKGITEKRDLEMDGVMTYAQGFGAGVLVTLFASLLVTLSTVVMMSIYGSEILEASMDAMERQNPEMSDQQIEMAMSMTRSFSTPLWAGVMGFFSGMIAGSVWSLIVAAFTKKEDEQNIGFQKEEPQVQ